MSTISQPRQRGVFALFGRYLPSRDAATQFEQHILVSKFLADAGRDAVRYTALIVVVRNGGSAFQSSLVGVAVLLPTIFFALYGGAIADSLPKRVALGGAYLANAAACVIIPFFFGTSVASMVVLVFIVAVLTQVSSPAEQTVVPLVSSQGQLASAVSLMGLTSSAGSAVGTALLAPVLLKAFGEDVVFAVSAALLLGAMSRIVHVQPSRDVQLVRWVRPKSNLRRVLGWLVQNPAIATMVGVAVLSGVGFTIMTILAPTYVAEVLGMDPANTVYIIGVAGAGTTVALLIVPSLLKRVTERWVAGVGFLLEALGLVGLGLVGAGIGTWLDPINPVHWLGAAGIDIDQQARTAAFIAFPLGLGNGMTDNAVRTYLNRRVPLGFQGRMFALKNLLEAAATVIPLLTVAAIATAVGVSPVLVLTPFLLYGLAIALVRLSASFSGEPSRPGLGVLASYWEEPEGVLTPYDDGSSPPSAASAQAAAVAADDVQSDHVGDAVDSPDDT